MLTIPEIVAKLPVSRQQAIRRLALDKFDEMLAVILATERLASEQGSTELQKPPQYTTFDRAVSDNNTSLYGGVTWDRHINLWQVTINHKGFAVHIGYFKDLEEAIVEHERKRKEFFGV